MKKRHLIGGGAVLAIALTVGGAVAPAAAYWEYPGGVTCPKQNATTDSVTQWGTVEHRVEGYSGYHYATFQGWPWITPYAKHWGWNTIFNTRIGGAAVLIEWTGVYCHG